MSRLAHRCWIETIIAMRTGDLNATDFISRVVERSFENRAKSSDWINRRMEISAVDCEER
jgi:hypothetical protein